MNLIGTFAEGFGATRQPCTLPLLISALVFVLAAGRRAPVVAGAHLAGLAFLAWARFARIWTIEIQGWSAVAAGLLVAAAAVGVAATRERPPWWAAGPAVLGGAVAAAIWQPCVGRYFADIVNDAPTDRVGSVPLTMAYVLGIGLLPLVIGVIVLTVPRAADLVDRIVVVRVGATLGATLGLLMAVGVWADIVEELTRRTII